VRRLRGKRGAAVRPLIVFVRGQRFGSLEVVASVGVQTNRHGRTYGAHLVRCDCGRELVVSSYELKAGHVTSCGCLKGEKFRRALDRAQPRRLWIARPLPRPTPESLRPENLPKRPPARKAES
jgi:hypothetical protein